MICSAQNQRSTVIKYHCIYSTLKILWPNRNTIEVFLGHCRYVDAVGAICFSWCTVALQSHICANSAHIFGKMMKLPLLLTINIHYAKRKHAQNNEEWHEKGSTKKIDVKTSFNAIFFLFWEKRHSNEILVVRVHLRVECTSKRICIPGTREFFGDYLMSWQTEAKQNLWWNRNEGE